MHKDTHTAVFTDCWTNILGSVTFENRPSKFDKFLLDVKRICGDLLPVFGLEDTHGFGRTLAVYLVGHKYIVKHVNPAYTYSMRKSAPMSQKDDNFDAYCVARILRDKIGDLPDAQNEDIYWAIRHLVKRRDLVTKSVVTSKNQLHAYLHNVFPGYTKFFNEIDCKTALFFWENYPCPEKLKDVSPEELKDKMREVYKSFPLKKAHEILSLVEANGVTATYQEERSFIIKCVVEDIKSRNSELNKIDAELEKLIPQTGYKLQTMPGINLITESQIISEIGDINRFPNSNKLSKFAGIAPINFSSAGKGKDQRCRQGNRILNKVFHFLAIQLVQVNPNGKARHPAFRKYFEDKLKENKTKPQALVCVSKRALKVIYGMMKNKTEYRPFEEET